MMHTHLLGETLRLTGAAEIDAWAKGTDNIPCLYKLLLMALSYLNNNWPLVKKFSIRRLKNILPFIQKLLILLNTGQFVSQCSFSYSLLSMCSLSTPIHTLTLQGSALYVKSTRTPFISLGVLFLQYFPLTGNRNFFLCWFSNTTTY